MKELVNVLLSAQLAVLIISASTPASAELEIDQRLPVLILQEGDVIPGTGGRTVTTLSGPVNAGGDHVAIGAVLTDGGEGALWAGHRSGQQTHLILASDLGALALHTNRFGFVDEQLMGAAVEPHAQHAVVADMSDSDRVLLTTGEIAQRIGASAPGLGRDTTITAIKRIQMLLNGHTFWVADWSAPGASGRAFYRARPGPKSAVELRMNSGDAVCDYVLRDLHHFRVAQNQTHGHVIDLSTGTGIRTALFVDGQCPYSLGTPLPGSSERPTKFWHFDVNSSGHVLFGAVTDGLAHRNAVYVLDGAVVMREGDVIDGIRIDPPNAEPNEVRLDDRGRAVTLWTGPATSIFTIFYTPDIGNFADTRKLVSENTGLDFDGDGQVDATLYRFRFFSSSGPTFSLGETGIFIAVLLKYPGSTETVPAVIFYPF